MGDMRCVWRFLFSSILVLQLSFVLFVTGTVTLYLTGRGNYVLAISSLAVSFIAIGYKCIGLYSVWDQCTYGIEVFINFDIICIAVLFIVSIFFHIILSEAAVLQFYYNFIEQEYGSRVKKTPNFLDFVDHFQVEFSCCGVRSYTDFMDAVGWKNKTKGLKVPPSCCKIRNRQAYMAGTQHLALQDESCPVNPTFKNSHIRFSCSDAIMVEASRYRAVSDFCFGATVLLEIFCIMSAWTIARHIEEWEIYQRRLDHMKRKCNKAPLPDYRADEMEDNDDGSKGTDDDLEDDTASKVQSVLGIKPDTPDDPLETTIY